MTSISSHLIISTRVSVPLNEIEMTSIRAQGAGGQNVNKVASAIHLRFDVLASSLPEIYKERLLVLKDKRITEEGVIVLKAQRFRTREKNREDALERLRVLIRSVSLTPKSRKPTKPSRSSQRKRMDTKKRRGQTKLLRGRVID